MSPYAVIPLFVLSTLLQSTWLSRLSENGLHPHLTLLMVISWSLLRGAREGAIWGFIGGLIFDLLSNTPLGLNALLLTIAGYLSGLGESRIFRSNFLLPIFLLTAITSSYMLAQIAIFRWLDRPLPLLETTFNFILPTVGLNLLVWPVVYLPLRWLSRATGREELRW